MTTGGDATRIRNGIAIGARWRTDRELDTPAAADSAASVYQFACTRFYVRERSESGSGITINGNEERRSPRRAAPPSSSETEKLERWEVNEGGGGEKKRIRKVAGKRARVGGKDRNEPAEAEAAKEERKRVV